MNRSPVQISTVYRLSDGRRKEYTTTAGWFPWRWTWSFERMPYFYVGKLWQYYSWDKGTTVAFPLAIVLKPNMQEIGTESLNTSWVPVSIESLSTNRQMGPMKASSAKPIRLTVTAGI